MLLSLLVSRPAFAPPVVHVEHLLRDGCPPVILEEIDPRRCDYYDRSTGLCEFVIGDVGVYYFDGGDWVTEAFTGNRLCVADGTQVNFAIWRTGRDERFPSEHPPKWKVKGVSGTVAEGVGSRFNHRFLLSSAVGSDLAAHEFEIEVFCGESPEVGKAATLHVTVFDLNVKVTPSDNFQARSLESFGVGEAVSLNIETIPPLPREAIGSPVLALESGNSVFSEDSDGGGMLFCWFTRDAPTLRLRFTEGVNRYSFYHNRPHQFEVVPPSRTVSMARLPMFCKLNHTYGWYGTGAKMVHRIEPSDVSFHNALIRENSCVSIKQGWFWYINLFPATHSPWSVFARGIQRKNFDVNIEYEGLNSANYLNILDFVHTGSIALPTNNTVDGNTVHSYTSGYLEWNISITYKIHYARKSLSGVVSWQESREQEFATVRHAQWCDDNGKAELRKGNVYVESELLDQSTDWDFVCSTVQGN